MNILPAATKLYRPSQLSTGDVVLAVAENNGFEYGIVVEQAQNGTPQIAALDGQYAFRFWAFNDEYTFFRLIPSSEVIIRVDLDTRTSNNPREVGSISIDEYGSMVCLIHIPQGFTQEYLVSLSGFQKITHAMQMNQFAVFSAWKLGYEDTFGEFIQVFEHRPA